MRWKICFLLTVLFLALSVTLVIANPMAAGFEIPWWTVDGGGGNSQGGSYILSGSIGQADAGNTSGGGYPLISGFWSVTQQETRIYLPLVIR